MGNAQKIKVGMSWNKAVSWEGYCVSWQNMCDTADALLCPQMIEDANITGMRTNCIFALRFLLQEERKSGSDLSWWWSLLFAECRGDIGLCSWGCRKSKESWKARPAHANSWAHLWVYYQALYWFELPPIRQPKPWHQHFLSIWNGIV